MEFLGEGVIAVVECSQELLLISFSIDLLPFGHCFGCGAAALAAIQDRGPCRRATVAGESNLVESQEVRRG